MATQSSALVKSATLPSLEVSEAELLSVLSTSLYPGAKIESIKLVIGYCRAAGLDPMQKPVHIVPMSVKVGDDKYEMRDVVMPGIGLYRTQASRTGEYVGATEPEFGPSKTLKLGDFEMEYPEWCRMTVKRLVDGKERAFTAVEYWLENYATKRRDSKVPNAMWQKRPFGQLAKCAEAQALRKAFPELVGTTPTADELEGKVIDSGGGVIDGEVVRSEVSMPRSTKEPSAQQATTPPMDETPAPTGRPSEPAGAEPASSNGNGEDKPLSDGAKNTLRKALERAGRTDVDLKAKFGKGIDEMSFGPFNDVMTWVKANPAS